MRSWQRDRQQIYDILIHSDVIIAKTKSEVLAILYRQTSCRL